MADSCVSQPMWVTKFTKRQCEQKMSFQTADSFCPETGSYSQAPRHVNDTTNSSSLSNNFVQGVFSDSQGNASVKGWWLGQAVIVDGSGDGAKTTACPFSFRVK